MKVFGGFCKGWPALHQEQAVHQQIRGNTQEPVAKSLVNFIHTSELQPISISSTLIPRLAAMQFVRLRFEGCWFGSLCLLKSLERRSVFDCMQQLFNGQSFFRKQFTVGVLNATLDLAALVLVGVVGFLGSEVVLSPVVSRCLPLSPVVSLHVGGGCWLVWPHLEQKHSEIKITGFNLNLFTVNCLGSTLV